MSYLNDLEAESIVILREMIEFAHPVLLYSIGKDSSVLLHLARKAFYPGKIPFPVLHIDTGWKFHEMIAHRDQVAQQYHLNLLVYSNEQGKKDNVTPFTHGSRVYTDIMKTQALKQALQSYGFDVAIGGARRDEERSRAKERIYSLRDGYQRWDPRHQQPELWQRLNSQLLPDYTMRVFPLSNWTELDIWRYIKQEKIAVVPLYFAAKRFVVQRSNQWLMVDDDRFVLQENETVYRKSVRFRTLGCYPLTAAIESQATTIDELLQEMQCMRYSERQGRLIDGDAGLSSMEEKKKEGYF